jgi:cob(I)alamin adenosyltransferase
MKIYTKSGDKGKTSLFGGERVSKDALRIEAYGTIDELNSEIGVVRAMKPARDIDLILDHIQRDLFLLGADLATPRTKDRKKVPRVEPGNVEQIERTIDRLDSSLEPLQQFVLPGGSRIAAEIHIARAICRRAERRVVELSRKNDIGSTLLVYINRLSDLLFVMARYVNKEEKVEEVKWGPDQSP